MMACLQEAGVSPPLRVKLKPFNSVGDSNSLNVFYHSAGYPSSTDKRKKSIGCILARVLL